MKNKFVKMTAAVLAGMMLLTGCGQSADSTGAANDSEEKGKENTTADAAVIAADDGHPVAEFSQPFSRCRNGSRILVNADEPSLF